MGATAHLSKLATELLKEYISVFPPILPLPTEPPKLFKPAVTPLSAEAIANLVAAYQDGETITSISNRIGVHRGTVYHRLNRAGIQLRQGEALSPIQVQQATRRYEAGDSLATVGQAFGVDAQTVRNHLAKAGVEIKKRRGWTT